MSISTKKTNINKIFSALKMVTVWRWLPSQWNLIWRQYVSPKRWYLPASIHGVTAQKNKIKIYLVSLSVLLMLANMTYRQSSKELQSRNKSFPVFLNLHTCIAVRLPFLYKPPSAFLSQRELVRRRCCILVEGLMVRDCWKRHNRDRAGATQLLTSGRSKRSRGGVEEWIL
jgi:hypothetical protein